ncbi:hypothetical protein L9F63_010936, partial [Diploptera punctata]
FLPLPAESRVHAREIASRGLNSNKIIQILDEHLLENITICHSGSEIEDESLVKEGLSIEEETIVEETNLFLEDQFQI